MKPSTKGFADRSMQTTTKGGPLSNLHRQSSFHQENYNLRRTAPALCRDKHATVNTHTLIVWILYILSKRKSSGSAETTREEAHRMKLVQE